MNTKRLTLLTVGATILLGFTATHTAQAEPQDPADIKGVKWKQHPVGFMEEKVDWWLEKPKGTTIPRVVSALKRNGVNAVVIRVDDENRFHGSGTSQMRNYDRAMSEIAKAVGILKSDGVGAYLWARVWLERDGKPNKRTVDEVVESVHARFEPVLDKIKANGDLDGVNGLVLIEINCDRIEDVCMYARRIADRINLEAKWQTDRQGFLQNRTFLVPGAGFGLDFRDLEDRTFLADMEKKCGYFAFVYKFMRAAHESITKDDYYNVMLSDSNRYTWSDMEKNDPAFTVALRKEFLCHFNLDGLVRYLRENSEYDRANRVVFWGDKWDGISQIPELSRTALYELMVLDERSIRKETRGKFFCMTAVKESAANRAIRRLSYLNWNLQVNTENSRSETLTVGQEWQNWGTKVDPQYD